MNRMAIMRTLQISLLSAGITLLCFVTPGLAGEASSDWRPTYDTIMRWVNFGILFFVIIKYGRKPLLNFLNVQKESIQEELDEIQQEKDEMAAKGLAAVKALEESKERFEQIEARIIGQGQRSKDELITEAEQQSQLMIESARHKIDYQIHRAKEKMRSELLNMAVDQALTQLPDEITPEDNQRLLNKYLAAAVSHK